MNPVPEPSRARWTERPEQAIRKSANFARQALQAAANDSDVVANAVFALAYSGENISAMIALIDHALSLNPSLARGWYVSSHVRLLAGELKIAIEHAEASVRLSPRVRRGSHYHPI